MGPSGEGGLVTSSSSVLCCCLCVIPRSCRVSVTPGFEIIALWSLGGFGFADSLCGKRTATARRVRTVVVNSPSYIGSVLLFFRVNIPLRGPASFCLVTLLFFLPLHALSLWNSLSSVCIASPLPELWPAILCQVHK